MDATHATGTLHEILETRQSNAGAWGFGTDQDAIEPTCLVVLAFQRPSFKQSTETLFLQMAESGAVDRPALAPIGFGISSFREVTYDAR